MKTNQKILNFIFTELNIKINKKDTVINYILDHSGFDVSVMYASIRIREEFGNNAEVLLMPRYISINRSAKII